MNRIACLRVSQAWRGRCRALALVTAAALAMHGAMASPGPQPAPLRLMLIGDSITEGDAGGYRLPLYRRIVQTWGLPNFVGHRNSRLSDPQAFLDNDHDGYSAYRIEQITSGQGFWRAPSIEQRLADWSPAVVTIHAGTNDAQQNYLFDGDATRGIPPVIDRLDDLVSRIVAHDPSIHIIVAQIVPANAPASTTTQDYVVRLNALIPGLVARHQAQGHRVSLVDLYTPMLAYPHPDGIHPGPAGYEVMAQHLFTALQALGVRPVNPDPGRDDGLQQTDTWSPSPARVWALQDNLLRGAAMAASGYPGGVAPALLHDGLADGYTVDADNRFNVEFALDTTAHAQGYDVHEIRSLAGRPPADNGDERAHQAYGVHWMSVDEPGVWHRLGDAHHILIGRGEASSQIVLRRPDGRPLATRVARLAFRFVEPPRRQTGVFGVTNATHYRELEALGQPSP